MKKLLTILFALLLVGGFVANAGAWQVELGDAYDNLGYWALDVNFSGDATDNLNDLNFTVAYDTNDLEWAALQTPSYDNGQPEPFTQTIWEGGALPHNADTPGLVYNIMGGEILGNPGVFFPVASENTLLATLFFTDLGGADDTSAFFTNGHDITELAWDAVSVNGVTTHYWDLIITADTISPVPIPGAVWLLGSGLLGLIGIRRRTKTL